jgi:hypothetical protein
MMAAGEMGAACQILYHVSLTKPLSIPMEDAADAGTSG